VLQYCIEEFIVAVYTVSRCGGFGRQLRQVQSIRVRQLRQVRQAVAAGAIDFAVSLLPRVAAGQSIAAGAIDFVVFFGFFCFMFFLLLLPCAAAS
jgi:ABC-type nitrate/sulfonate/bicarbonate transport system substrate-binding protein